MADSADSTGLSAAPAWTVAVLLLFLVGLTEVFVLLLGATESYFERKGSKYLVTFLHHLKSELLLLGFVSIFLSVFQTHFAKICYRPSTSPEYDSFLDVKPELNTSLSSDCYDTENPCPDGMVQLWSVKLQHETHIFIFSVALSHIASSVLILITSRWIISLWLKWEDSCHAELMISPSGMSKTWIAILFRGVTRPVYTSVRALFIIDLPINTTGSSAAEDLTVIDFHRIVRRVSEERLASIMSTHWLLWLVAIFLMAVPMKFDAPAWSCFLSFILLLLVGSKLTWLAKSVLLQSSSRVDSMNTTEYSVERERKRIILRLALLQQQEEKRLLEMELALNEAKEGAIKRQLTRRMQSIRRQGHNISYRSTRDPSSESNSFKTFSVVCGNFFALNQRAPDVNKSLLRRLAHQFQFENLQHFDLTDLLYFKSPGLLVFLIQLIFFQLAMNLAIAGFSLFVLKNEGLDQQFDPVGNDSLMLAVLMIVLNVILLCYGALVVLPLLSLLFPLSSKCSDAVIQKAISEVQLINGETGIFSATHSQNLDQAPIEKAKVNDESSKPASHAEVDIMVDFSSQFNGGQVDAKDTQVKTILHNSPS